MGPESIRLTQARATARRGVACAVASLALVSAAGPPCAAGEPPAGSFVEEERVQRVQIDVSVIDTRRDRRASVPGLPRDAFELRLDGLPLPDDVRGRVEFDEVCTGREGSAVADDRWNIPTIVALVDLNFLDVQMRHNVGRALDDLADAAETTPLRVKVIAFARRLTPLMADFSSEPDEIRRAARALTEVVASGPPRGPAPPTSSDFVREHPPEQPYELSPELRDSFGRDEAPDPDRDRPAFVIDPTASDAVASAPGIVQPALSPTFELTAREVDPRPSLAALEAVMLSHSAIRGQKALVLFSSAWFDLPEELWLTYLEGPRVAAQAGFTIWSVDARGLGGSSGYHSRLLGHIATSSGGEAIRSAGRLATGFDRALSQLSCYYLFSVPIESPPEGVRHHHVDVRLDTAKYPDFWRYRVRAASGFTLFDPVRQRQRARLAALMEPQGYGFPEVRITSGYPDGRLRFVTPIEVSVLLSDLTFLEAPSGDALQAEVSWEGVVTSDHGRQVCILGDGRRRVVRTASPPSRQPPTMLVLRTACALPGPGAYDVRAVLEDLVSGDIGAGTALIEIVEPDGGLAPVSAIRLGRNSGLDFLLEFPAGSAVEVPRDAQRRGFTPLRPGEALVPQERMIVRFVSCNEDDPPPVLLYRRARDPSRGQEGDRGDAEAAAILFQVSVAPRAELTGEDGRCREYEGIVPENTLDPGGYGLAFVDRRLPVGDRDELDRLVAAGRAGAFVEFDVAAPPTRPKPDPERTARLSTACGGR